MATRYYFPSTGAADVSPSPVGFWEKTSEVDYLKMVTTKISSAFSGKSCSENNVNTNYDVLNRIYVSEPIGVTTFTKLLEDKVQIRCQEDNAKADFELIGEWGLFNNDGTLRRGGSTINAVGGEFEDGSYVNRGGITSRLWAEDKICENGDRIVVQIGIRATNTKTTLYTATMDFGDASGTDLPENETETTQYNPWIEFSENIAAYVPPSDGYVPKIIMIT